MQLYIILHLITGVEGLLKLLVVVRSPRRAQSGLCINLLAARRTRSQTACLPFEAASVKCSNSGLMIRQACRFLPADPVYPQLEWSSGQICQSQGVKSHAVKHRVCMNLAFVAVARNLCSYVQDGIACADPVSAGHLSGPGSSCCWMPCHEKLGAHSYRLC